MTQPEPTTDHLIVFLEWLDSQGFLDSGCKPERTHEEVATRYLFERATAGEALKDPPKTVAPPLACGCKPGDRAYSAHNNVNAWCGWRCTLCGQKHHRNPSRCIRCGHTVLAPMHMEDWNV